MPDTDPPASPAEPAAPAGDNASGGNTATVEKSKAAPRTSPTNKTDKLPPYNVVLLDDDHHTYAYVIEMLGKLFGYDKQKAFKMAGGGRLQGPRHRPNDTQGKGRAEARPDHRVRRGLPDGLLQGIDERDRGAGAGVGAARRTTG